MAHRLKSVSAQGTHENMGRKLGRECKREVSLMLSDAKEGFRRKGQDWKKSLAGARKHVPFVEEYDPDQLSFIRGYARGAGLSFEEVFILFCLDEKGLCTDVMVNGEATEDGGVYAAHTEDWTVRSEKYLVLVRARPRNKPSILMMTHGGLEWITGINSAGISISGNSLYQNDTRVGVPKLMVAPKVLASESLGEALAASAPPRRASSYCNNICHSSGEMYCVEGSATDFAVLYPDDGYLAHTNHYLHPSMARYEDTFGEVGARTLNGSSGTIVRYHRARRRVRERLGDVTIDALSDILRDHVNHPDSICSHPLKGAPEHERCKTTYAVVTDVVSQKMHICVGNPCEGEFKPYGL